MKIPQGNAVRMPLMFYSSLIAAVWCASAACAAEWELLATTLDGLGEISSNTVAFGDKDYRHVSAGFPPAVTASNPGLDRDGDGTTNAIYAGGTAPWYKTTNTHTWADAAPGQFLRVKTE